MKRHIVEIHMPLGCEVCERRLKPSRQLQDHKTDHNKITVYISTLEVFLSKMCSVIKILWEILLPLCVFNSDLDS